MKTMRSIWCLVTIMMVSMFCVFSVSCSKDEEAPEIKIPTGSEDFFSKSMDFNSSASEKKLTFSSNKSWTISVSDTRAGSSWLSVTPTSGEAGTQTVTVRAEENTTYDDRNAVISVAAGDSVRRVFVNQKQLDAITLTSDRFEVPVEGGSINVEVKANIDYEVVIPSDCQSWIHEKNSATRGLTASTVSFTIDKSEEYDKREGKIIIRGNGKEETVSIFQTGEGILTLTQNEYDLSSSAQEISIEISSNFDYTVDMPDVDWINEVTAETRGISTHTLRLAISENQDYDARSAKIKVYDKNSDLSEEVIINQAEGGPILVLTQKEYDLSSSAQDITVEISSNFDYAVDMPDVDWIQDVTSQTRGISTHTLKLAISENEDYDGRSAKIKIYDKNSDLFEEVTINQSQKNALIIDNKEYKFDEKGGSFSVEISSNIDYTVNITGDWIKEKKSSTRSLKKSTREFTVSEITDDSDREGKITFTNAKTGISEVVVVKQTRSIYLDKTTLDLMVGGEKTIKLTNNTDQSVKWTSSNESVVTVDENGLVKAIGKGTATITVKTEDGAHSCKCVVTVKSIEDCVTIARTGTGMSISSYGTRYTVTFTITNSSSETIHIVSLGGVVDGVEQNLGGGKSVSITLASSTSALQNFKQTLVFTYNGKEYSIQG